MKKLAFFSSFYFFCRFFVLSLGVSQSAFALRLGPITVNSYLRQPIDATIRVDGLSTSAASKAKVSLASPAAYRAHGIEMQPIHAQMRFSLIRKGKSYVIQVSSTDSLKEPFVNFLITVSSNGKSVTREYAAFFNPKPRAEKSPHLVAAKGKANSLEKALQKLDQKVTETIENFKKSNPQKSEEENASPSHLGSSGWGK